MRGTLQKSLKVFHTGLSHRIQPNQLTNNITSTVIYQSISKSVHCRYSFYKVFQPLLLLFTANDTHALLWVRGMAKLRILRLA